MNDSMNGWLAEDFRRHWPQEFGRQISLSLIGHEYHWKFGHKQYFKLDTNIGHLLQFCWECKSQYYDMLAGHLQNQRNAEKWVLFSVFAHLSDQKKKIFALGEREDRKTQMGCTVHRKLWLEIGSDECVCCIIFLWSGWIVEEHSLKPKMGGLVQQFLLSGMTLDRRWWVASEIGEPRPPLAHQKQPPGARNACLSLVGWSGVQRSDWLPLSSTGVHWSQQQIADSWDGWGRGKEFGLLCTKETRLKTVWGIRREVRRIS